MAYWIQLVTGLVLFCGAGKSLVPNPAAGMITLRIANTLFTSSLLISHPSVKYNMNKKYELLNSC
jgi:hypothetical protein